MDKVLRVIVVDDDANNAEWMISAIKGGDVAVRAKRVVSEDQLVDALKEHPPDIVLCAEGGATLGLERTLARIRETDEQAPVVSVADDAAEIVAHMHMGAADLVGRGQSEHLKLVVARAALERTYWREMKRLEAALQESEKGRRALLDGSRDAICFVHEGVMIYANAAHLTLLGYADMAEIEGTPFMDIVAPDQQRGMKDTLRKLEKGLATGLDLEIDLTRRDGSTFSARIACSSARLGGEACTQLVIHRQTNVHQPTPVVTQTVRAQEAAIHVEQPVPQVGEVVAQAEQAESILVDAGQPSRDHSEQGRLDEAWSARLREALANNRLRALFQPIVSLRGVAGARYECLLRLLDADDAEIPAAEFMASAERTGLVGALDRWVLTHSIDRLTEARRAGKDTVFFLKLTGATLQDSALPRWLSETLTHRRLAPSSLVISLKEETVIDCLKKNKTVVEDLKGMQCAFAIEEFGRGADPFQVLKVFSADYLKLDRSLMEDITSDADRQRALRGIVETANTQGKAVIAPFVQDASAMPVLWRLSVNFIQGYFLQAPSAQLDYDFTALN